MNRIIELENHTALCVDTEALEKIAQSLTNREIELVVTDNAHIRALNREYRKKDQPTDVLSFPLETPFTEQTVFDIPLGSIVISEEYVRAEAQRLSHSEQDELKLLFIHGLLHLMGYDHETDEGEMRRKEEAIIHMFNLPSSLIVRNEGNR